jgi:outer membrane protein TolC
MKKITFLLLFIVSLTYGQQQQFTMQEAIDFALDNNRSVLNAKLDIDAAKQKKWETTTMGLPQLNAKIDYQNFIIQPVSLIPAELFGGPAGQFAEISFGTKQNINASATLSQLVFNGSYLVGLESAKVYLKISDNALVKTKKIIKEMVISAYANVLLAEEGLLILNDNKTILDKNIKDTKALFVNGFVEEESVEQLELTRATLLNQINKTEQLKQTAYQMLNFTLGQDINTPITLTDSLASLANENYDLAITNAPFNLSNNVDYKIMLNQLEAKKLLLKLEKSKALPSVNTFLNFGYTGNNESFKFLKKEQTWYDSALFGVSVNIPIFSSLKRSSRTKQAKIALKQTERKLEETEQKLSLEYQNAKTNYNYAMQQYTIAKDNLDLAARIEKKQRIKFKEGISSSFELSTAQRQLYSMQQNYLQSIIDLINNKIKLEQIIE